MNGSLQINPRVIQVLQKQISELMKKPVDSVRYVFNECDILDIQADIIGPIGTPYADGVFRCKLVLNNEFPRVPPKGYFLTKIFHPNVSEKGEICVNTLKKDWDPSNWSLQHVFEVIRCLLIVPFPESSLNEEAGKLFMEDYEEYAKHARLITELYALPKEKPAQPLSSPLEKPSTAMDISFENTQEESPKKPFSGQMNTGIFTFDTQLTKQNSNDPSYGLFKTDRPDDVLMTVTNSLNTNPLSPADEGMFKKNGPVSPFGNPAGTGMGLVNTNPKATGNESISAKKENEKKWKKRI